MTESKTQGRKTSRRRAVSFGLAGALLVSPIVAGADVGAVAVAQQAGPLSFTVDTTSDAPDGNVGDGVCATAAGECSLRAAVAEANDTTVATIEVPAGTYVLDNAVGSDTGDLDLSAPMTITGAARQPGDAATTIVGSGDRVFEVLSGGVTLEGLVITGGFVDKGDGGGVLVGRNLSDATTVRNSTVTGNTAKNGAGISTLDELIVENSTFTANTATGSGGGIDVEKQGSLVASNSTFDGNVANDGGGISSAGAATLLGVTVTANQSNNSSGGGISRNGGSFDISGSILAGNTGANSARDCSGSPTFDSQNIVENTPGCNPSGTPLLIADPLLGPLQDNGGPTQTRLPDEGSPAIDAVVNGIVYTPCVTESDQRGVDRPSGAACDIGSVEVAPLSVDVSLTAASPATGGPACPEGVTCVGVGVSSVLVSDIPTEALVATSDPDDAADATYASRTYASRTYASRTYASRTDLQASPVSELTIEDLYASRTYASRTYASRTYASRTPIEQVLLSDITLFGTTWDDVLAGTEFEGVLLQNITLFDVIDLPEVKSLKLGDIDLFSTALKDLSGVAVALAPLSLNDIPFEDDPTDSLAAWCALIDVQIGDGACTDLGIVPASPATAEGFGLVSLELAGVDVESVGLESIYASRTDLEGTYLNDLYASRTDLAASAIGGIYASRTGGAPIDVVVNCDVTVDEESFPCDGTRTLAEFQQAGLIKPDATISDLLAYLAAVTEPGDISLFDLLLILTRELFPGAGPAYEQVDLRATPLQNFNSPELEPPAVFTATITVGGGSPADTTVALTLPEGFEPDPDSAILDGASIPDAERDGQTLTFGPFALSVGEHTLSVAARAGVDLGTKEATVRVDAQAGEQAAFAEDSTSVLVVVEAFENNGGPDDVRTAQPNTIYVAHISSSYDTDLYRFDVSASEAQSGVTARIDLTNLARDYDLVLYGPRAASLRGEPKSRLQTVEDTQPGFDSAETQLAPDVQLDVPADAPAFAECGGAAGCSPVAIAAQRGNTDELIETGTLIAGTYWIQVSGYNGDFGPEPYVVRLTREQGVPLGTCTDRTYTHAAAGPVVEYPAGVTAATATGYIIVPEDRLRQEYPENLYPDAINSVMSELNRVAAKASNAIVRVDRDATVKAAYAAWDDNPCSVEAANDVVRKIGKVLDELDKVTPNASTVTLVGNHIMTPMGLVADGTSIGNENTYDPGVEQGQDTSLTAALKAGYVMTDTPYGTSAGYLLNSAELYVPDRAVGRLVESPADIAATLKRFADGEVLDTDTTTSAFVSGYDFIADGAEAAAKALEAQAGVTVTRTINETWGKADLEKGLITDDPDLASISAHFDHNRAVPADADKSGDQTKYFVAADVAKSSNLTNALVLSIGCHSGLSVPDVELALNDRVDWAQTFAGEGATYLGNTGYGYGDSDLVLYSERLQELFVEQLRTGATVGAAMMAAKQAHFSELTAISPYDAKVLSEWTLYGLPMWQVGGAYTPPQSAQSLASTPSSLVEQATIEPVVPDSVVQQPVVLTVGTTDDPAENVLTPTPVPVIDPDTKQPVPGVDRTYYQQNGNIVALENRPVQPSVERDVTRPGRTARGVVITDAVSEDIANFEPYYARPVVDKAANEFQWGAIGDAVFPTTLARVSNPVQADGSTASTLTLAAGQFRRDVDGTPGLGTQRLFTRIDTEVYYAGPSEPDFEAPRIVRSEGTVVGNTVGFTIRTAPDAERVYVLYKPANGDDWAGVDLVRTGDDVDDSAIWTGGAVLPFAGDVEFLGQAVDGVGNVSYTVNKTSNFLAAPQAECALERSLSLEPTASGWFVAPTGVTIDFVAEDVVASVDGGAFAAVADGIVSVVGEGVHQVRVVSALGSCTLSIPIDTIGPEMTATPDVGPNEGGWNEGTVTVTLKAVDPGGSGVESITYAVNGVAAAPFSGDRIDVPVTTKGTTTITSSAVDAAGNRGPTITTTVKIDDIAPKVSSVITPLQGTPTPNGSGWYRGAVTVDVTATDAETGVREIRTTVNGNTVTTPGGTASRGVAAEGITTVSYTAVDNAGNEASGSTEVKIDATAPKVSITSPPTSVALGASATAGFTCTDTVPGVTVSGIASCTATLTGPGVNTTVTNGQSLPTGTAGAYTLKVTARDVAGNETSASRSYTVAYRVCLQYNDGNPQPVGGTYPLKFQLCNASGTNLSSSQITVKATLIDGTTKPPPNFQGNSNLGDAFRYDPKGKFYIYNLDTTNLSPTAHTLGFTVNGVGSPSYVLPFILK